MENKSRRKFIGNSIKATMAIAIGGRLFLDSQEVFANQESDLTHWEAHQDTFKFTQVPLGFSYDALEPHIDALTNEIHYTKHHAAYIKNVNEAIAAEKLQVNSEAEFFSQASRLSAKLRNNGGGAWNHNFFWQGLTPDSSGPEGKIKDLLIHSFGSIEQFKDQFTQASLGRFGSGWTWLISDNSQLKIISTANQDNPLFDDAQVKGLPLLALDVWEHAYYLKYQNRRNEYVAGWWNVVNWNEVNKRLV